MGKLNVYRNADAVELAGLHPSDRLMVKLIQIDRLGPRIEGMLYRVSFEETWSLLDEGASKLVEAGNSLLAASSFKELLNLILLIGNYMNGTGIKGGAFGFRISSINKLVDTKSVNNTTLLHFLEKTVSKHFPEMEKFLDELEKPAEAYRINLQDLRKGLSELRDGLKRIRKELEEHFSDPLEDDRYGKQMWQFVAKATNQVEDLVDDVNNAEATFNEAVSYYGEEDKGMSSSEFYGIFKTFVTSYRVCFHRHFHCLKVRFDIVCYRNAERRISSPRKNALRSRSGNKPRKNTNPTRRRQQKPRRRKARSSTISSRSCVTATPQSGGAASENAGRPQRSLLRSIWIPLLVQVMRLQLWRWICSQGCRATGLSCPRVRRRML